MLGWVLVPPNLQKLQKACRSGRSETKPSKRILECVVAHSPLRLNSLKAFLIMDFKRLKKQMNQVIIQVPSINTHGLIPANSSSFDDMQDDLFNSLEQFYWCQEWLKKCQLRKTFNTNHSSYGYKHMVEDWIRKYVSNGTFIAATIALQIPYKPTGLNSPNIYLPISEKCFARETNGRFYLKEAVPGSNTKK